MCREKRHAGMQQSIFTGPLGSQGRLTPHGSSRSLGGSAWWNKTRAHYPLRPYGRFWNVSMPGEQLPRQRYRQGGTFRLEDLYLDVDDPNFGHLESNVMAHRCR